MSTKSSECPRIYTGREYHSLCVRHTVCLSVFKLCQCRTKTPTRLALPVELCKLRLPGPSIWFYFRETNKNNNSVSVTDGETQDQQYTVAPLGYLAQLLHSTVPRT